MTENVRPGLKAILDKEAENGFYSLSPDEMQELRLAFVAGEIPIYRYCVIWPSLLGDLRYSKSDGERYTREDASRAVQSIIDSARHRLGVQAVVTKEPTETWARAEAKVVAPPGFEPGTSSV